MNNRLCPYCNGLKNIVFNCPACDCPLDDCGPLQNILSSYSPYEEHSLLLPGCVHRFFCPACYSKYEAVPAEC